MANLFFSYCHIDEALRNELEVHLSLLKRQGIIEAWHDRRISAGSNIDNNISQYLENSDVILLLVSAHFLNSDYCYEKEMMRALQKHEAKEAIVIPVILQPCDWLTAPFGKLRATPTDGKAVTMYANQQEALSIIAKDIRDALENLELSSMKVNETIQPIHPNIVNTEIPLPRTSNLRVKKTFSDHEKRQFLEDSFEYLTRFFEGSLTELEQRNPQIQIRFRKINAKRFIAHIYENGDQKSVCTIWLGGEQFDKDSICYSATETESSNSMNDWLSVENDGYTLYLKASGISRHLYNTPDQLSKQGAAEYFWSSLILPFQ